MQTNKSLVRLLNKNLLALSLSLVAVICFSANSFSQQVLKSKPVVQIGNVDSTMRITRDKLLANTHVKCALPYCEVTSFSVSISRSNGQRRGPYKIKDSDYLSEAVIKVLKENTTAETNILITDISVVVNGIEHKTSDQVSFICVPK